MESAFKIPVWNTEDRLGFDVSLFIQFWKEIPTMSIIWVSFPIMSFIWQQTVNHEINIWYYMILCIIWNLQGQMWDPWELRTDSRSWTCWFAPDSHADLNWTSFQLMARKCHWRGLSGCREQLNCRQLLHWSDARIQACRLQRSGEAEPQARCPQPLSGNKLSENKLLNFLFPRLWSTPQ